MSQQAPAVTINSPGPAVISPTHTSSCSSTLMFTQLKDTNTLNSSNYNNQRRVLYLHTIRFDIFDKELCKLAPPWFTVRVPS